jgi:tetratricopeptide (TPR) repeat protein
MSLLRTCCLLLWCWACLVGPAWAQAASAQSEDERGLAQLMQAEFALQSGQNAEAVRLLTEAAASRRDAALAERAALLAISGNLLEQAGPALVLWRELAPDNVAAWRFSAVALLRAGERDQARPVLARLLGWPDEAGWKSAFAALWDARAVDSGRLTLDMLESLRAGGSLPADAEAWLGFAAMARELGDAELTDRLSEGLAEKFPEHPRGLLVRAQRQREYGDLAGAYALLQRLRSSADGDPELIEFGAEQLALHGHWREAADWLGELVPSRERVAQQMAWLGNLEQPELLRGLAMHAAAVSFPNEAERDLWLASFAVAAEDWEAAELRIKALPPAAAADARMLRARMATLRTPGEAGLAGLRSLQQDEEADGEVRREAFLLEAWRLREDGDTAAALAAIERGLAVFEADPLLRQSLAQWLDEDGHHDEAIAQLRKAAEENPDDASVLNSLGYSLALRRADYAEALPLLVRADALSPGNPSIQDSVGWVRLKLGETEAALPLLRWAWSREAHPEIAAHLGEAWWVAGQRERARAVWEAGRALDPRHEVWDRIGRDYPP